MGEVLIVVQGPQFFFSGTRRHIEKLAGLALNELSFRLFTHVSEFGGGTERTTTGTSCDGSGGFDFVRALHLRNQAWWRSGPMTPGSIGNERSTGTGCADVAKARSATRLRNRPTMLKMTSDVTAVPI